jgi:hypothetical protein
VGVTLGLEERINAFRPTANREVKSCARTDRAERPEIARWSAMAEHVLRHLNIAFAAFNRGRGFLGFRAKSLFHLATFCIGTASSLSIEVYVSSAFQAQSRFAGIGTCPASRHRQSSPVKAASGTSSFSARFEAGRRADLDTVGLAAQSDGQTQRGENFSSIRAVPTRHHSRAWRAFQPPSR